MILRILLVIVPMVTTVAVACANAEEQTELPQASPTLIAGLDRLEQSPTAALIEVATLQPMDAPTATATASPTQEPTTTPMPKPTTTPTPLPTATAIPSPTPTATRTGPTVDIGDATFDAEIADTPELRSKGLGERDNLAEQSGMLFVFPSGQASSFWMKGMRFPLDFVWIGADCTVVGLNEDVQHPPPNTPNSEMDIITSSSPAAYTFEINAGEISRFGIEIGDEVRFHNIESEFAERCETGACDGN